MKILKVRDMVTSLKSKVRIDHKSRNLLQYKDQLYFDYKFTTDDDIIIRISIQHEDTLFSLKDSEFVCSCTCDEFYDNYAWKLNELNSLHPSLDQLRIKKPTIKDNRLACSHLYEAFKELPRLMKLWK